MVMGGETQATLVVEEHTRCGAMYCREAEWITFSNMRYKLRLRYARTLWLMNADGTLETLQAIKTRFLLNHSRVLLIE